MKMMTALGGFAFALTASATTYWVDGRSGDDGNTGMSRSEAFRTVQKAFDIEGTNPGDDEIVLVAGTHTVSEETHINAYCIIRGETGNPEDVIIDGGSAHRVMRTSGSIGASRGKKLQIYGITFANGYTSADRYNCLLIQSGVIVSNCVVRGCGVGTDVSCAAVRIQDGGLFTDSIVTNCESKGTCSAVAMTEGGVMRNCLITDCRNTNKAGAAVAGVSGGFIYDCVVSHNVGKLGSGFYGDAQLISNTVFRCNQVSFNTPSRLSGTVTVSKQGDGVVGGMKIIDCQIIDNVVEMASCGGLYVDDSISALEVVKTEISRNAANDGDYGGVYVQNENVIFSDCEIRGNSCGGVGGGLGGFFTLQGCVVAENAAGASGGGIAVIGSSDGSAFIESCLISNNVANAAKANTSGGGGIWFKAESDSAGLVSRCRIVDNRATNSHGGGIFVRGKSSGDTRGPINVRSCFFKGNYAKENGGAVNAISYPPFYIDNCTFAENSAAVNGNGLYIRWSGVSVRNSIVAATDMFSDTTMNNSVYFHNCCIPVADLPTCAPVYEGNINSNPRFADASNGDYSLAERSPCVNSGVRLDWMDEASLDIDGTPRIWHKGKELPDIGAWEFRTKLGLLVVFR